MRLSNNNILSLAAIAFAGTWTCVSADEYYYQGCYNATSETISADWVALGSYMFQAVGYCERACYESGYSVIGLMDGNQCLCGSVVPPSSDLVDESSCDTPCEGYFMDTCGGRDALDIYSPSDATTGTASGSDSTATITGLATVPTSSAGGIGTLLDSSSSVGETIIVTADLTSSSASSIAAVPTTTALKSSSSGVSTPSATTATTTTAASPTSTGAAAAVRVQGAFGMIAGLVAVLL